MEIDPSNFVYQDFKRQCCLLGIPEELHDPVIAMIDYPVYDLCVHPSFEGDERMQQFVILAFNNLNRELGLGYDELEMAPIPPDTVYFAEDFKF